MAEQRQHKRGTTVYISVTIRDVTDALVDPSSIVVSVSEFTTGTLKVTSATMTKISTGKYYYNCQTGDSWTVDWYNVLIVAVSGGYTVKIEDTKSFKLV